jgi:hypothetical protein
MMSRGYVYVHVYWRDRAGQIGESGSLGREGQIGETKHDVATLRFQSGSPYLCLLRTESFWPRWQALTYTDRMSGLWAPVNLVAQ